MQFVCFHTVDASKNVGIPIDWIDAITLGCSDEGEMNGNGFCAVVGASKQTIFPHENPAFNCPLGLVVVDRDVRVFEKSGQCSPMLQSVIDCLGQFVSRSEVVFSSIDYFSQTLHERLGFFSSHRQTVVSVSVFNLTLDAVKFSVYLKNSIANIGFGKLSFEIFAARVSRATGFNSLSILKQSIESAGSVSLNDAFKVFEKLQVFIKRQIRREIEHCDFRLHANVRSNFAFADIVFVFAVLNFDGGIVSLDDSGSEQMFFLKVVQNRKSVCSRLHPVALSRAWDSDVMASEDLFLTVVGKSVVELADDYFREQTRTGVAAGNWRARFFRSYDVLLAARTGACFLQVLDYLQPGAHHFKLVSEGVANVNSFGRAAGTERVFRLDRMMYRIVRNIFGIFENMFDAGFCFSFPSFFSSGLWAGIVLLRLFTVVSLVAFFRLRDQNIELGLKILQQCAKFLVTFERLFELLLQCLVLLHQALIVGQRFVQSFFQRVNIIFHVAPLLVSHKLYTIQCH